MKSFAILVLLLAISTAEDCGRQAGGRLCPGGNCCSKWGWCGVTPDHCGEGCQSQCGRPTPSPPSAGGVGSIITRSIFEDLLKHRSDSGCSGGFYTYDAFIAAANSFPGFGTTGSAEQQNRELAAFLAQTSKETTGGWATAPDGPYRWGYCFTEERNQDSAYCRPTSEWQCNGNKKYFGRGPIQLSWNYNYGPAGRALGFDGINNPELVSRDPVISFKTAIWFWMTAQSPKPSCHDVILGIWNPSSADSAAGRTASYGTVTNIINGGLECGIGPDDRVKDRIGFFTSYSQVLGVDPGPNLDCYNQRPFAQVSSSDQALVESE